MIGVTIAIGEDYLFYATEAAKRFTNYTGLKTYILTEEHLKEVEHFNIFESARNFQDKVFFLKFFIFNFFQEDIVYFDADYCVIDHWNPKTIFDGRFTTVKDRVEKLFKNHAMGSDIQRYFNAGFFMASYSHHRRFFDRCIKVGGNITTVFGDQCIFNKVAQDSKLPINFIDKRYNCMDFEGVMLDSDVKSIHSSRAYDYYKQEKNFTPTKKYKWNLIEMAGLSGLATVVYEDKMQKGVYLHPDGITNEGAAWFVTNDHEMIICENYFDNPRRILSIYQQ